MLSKKLAALAALSLMVGSTAAVAQSAESLRLSNAPVERAGAEAEDANQLEGLGIVPIIGVVVVVLAILALTDTWPFDDDPDSP
jgi:hypothetical protein